MRDFLRQRGTWLILLCALLAILSAWEFDKNPPNWVYEVMSRE